MDILDIIMPNIVTLFLIVGMGLIIFMNKNFDKRDNTYFLVFILIALLLDISDMADAYYSSLPSLNNMRYLSSAVGYCLRPASVVIVIDILLRHRKFNYYIWIPVFVLAVLLAINPLTHWVFYFTDDNTFQRGVLGFLPHILSGAYAIFMIYLMFKMQKKVGTGEIVVISFIIFIVLGATLIETLTDRRFILPGAMIVSCAVYYIFLYVEISKRDALTGVYNRYSFYAYSKSLTHQSYSLVAVDLNGLKSINDTEGHEEGDKALCLLANTMSDVAKNAFRIFRMGGDEFVAIGKGLGEKEAIAYIEKAKEALKETPYMASFGYASSKEGKSFDEIVNQADSLLYLDKKNYPEINR